MADEATMARDWLTAGWGRFLPPQAMFLHVLVHTAMTRGVDGDLDELAATVGAEWFEIRLGGLDAELSWVSSGDTEDEEQRALDDEAKALFNDCMRRMLHLPPTTVRQLAKLMVDLGVFEVTIEGGVTRWLSPDPLPLVAEKVKLPEAEAKREDDLRWRALHERTAQQIIGHIVDEMHEPDEVALTLESFAGDLELDIADARFGLSLLIADGDFNLVDQASGVEVDPETVSADLPVLLRVDWERFNESRISVQLTDPDE